MQKKRNQIIKRIYILLPAQDSGLLKRETNKYRRGVKDLLAPKQTSSWGGRDRVCRLHHGLPGICHSTQ